MYKLCRARWQLSVLLIAGMAGLPLLYLSLSATTRHQPQSIPNMSDSSTMVDNTKVIRTPQESLFPNASRTREQRYRDRLWQLSLACEKMNRSEDMALSAEQIPSSGVVDREHALIYCGIPKVGSTFWSRVLKVIGSHGQQSSPFEKPPKGFRLPSAGSLRRQLNATETREFLKSSMSFLFVREPYGRLFSGYVDKIYHPNFQYWPKVGRSVVHAIRLGVNALSLNCGHDVKFSEMVKFMINKHKAQEKVDQHFSPMYLRCDPCQNHFDFIGKMESFKEDVDFLLEKMQNRYDDVHVKFTDFEQEAAITTATGHARIMFSSRKCIANTTYPLYNMLLRTWRDMQIRGVLSKTISMPISPLEAQTMSREDFTKTLVQAIKMPVNRTEVRLQREEALIQAYQSVPLEDMEQLRQVLLKDCQYFGYDDRPEKLFSRSAAHRSAESFDYFPGLTESANELERK